jgi:hypothetical protein
VPDAFIKFDEVSSMEPGSLAVCSIASAGAASEAGGLVDDTGGLGSDVTDVTDVTDGGGATIRSPA